MVKIHEDLRWHMWLSREEWALVAAWWLVRTMREQVSASVDFNEGMLDAASDLQRRYNYRFLGVRIDEETKPHLLGFKAIPREPGNRLHIDALIQHGRSFDWAWCFEIGIKLAETERVLEPILDPLRATQKQVLDMRQKTIDERTPEEEEALRKAMHQARDALSSKRPEEVN